MSLAGVLVLLLVWVTVLMVDDATTRLRVLRRIRFALSHAESSSSGEEAITRGEKLPLSSASPRLGVEPCEVRKKGIEREIGALPNTRKTRMGS